MNEEKIRKLAASCMSLADRLESGSGPKLGRDNCYLDGPCCTIGHALDGAGSTTNAAHKSNHWPISDFLETCALSQDFAEQIDAITDINDTTSEQHRAEVIIRPLRNFANYLKSLTVEDGLPND